VNNLPLANLEILNKKDLMSEMMIMGLRLIRGVSRVKFREKFGIEIDEIYGEEIKYLSDKNLIKNKKKRIYLTDKGLLLGNEVFRRFLK